uniref:Adenylate isopentenyltransferase n=1 Tax=Solanum lycopersicum TaxID=4081 RepID=A0A3Q7ITQ0_SOLLC
MGATGTGKSRLSVGSNSYIEKLVEDPVFMLKYKYDNCFIWIDVEQSVLNRRVDMRVDQMVKEGEIEPDSDFTAEDFCLQVVVYIEKIMKTQRVPIIVGGSNSYIEKHVEDPVFMFKYKYDSCFIWIDVEQLVWNRRVDMRVDQMVKQQSVLNRRVYMRVDQMVKAGLVDEVRQIFIPDADYTKGIRRSIGVPEMDRYLREETNIYGDDESKQMILQASISSIKRNTHVFKEDREEDIDEAWRNTVFQPCLDIQSVLNRRVDMRDDQMVKAGEIEPDSDFTAEDFCLQAVVYIEKILKTQCVPIIVGGSNSYIEKLVEDPVFMFKYKYDSCFIWIDGEQSVLNRRVYMRVNQMVKAGLVDEVRQIFIPDVDYTKGIQRSIGVPETDRYLREETNIDGDNESKQMILQASISSIKRNT